MNQSSRSDSVQRPVSFRMQASVGVLAFCLALAGCNSDGGSSDPSGGQTGASTTTSSLPSTSGSTSPASTADNAAPASQTPLVAASDKGLTLLSADFQRLYGPGLYRQDGLGNTVVGINKGQEQVISNRFRATSTGHLSHTRIYWQTGNGYSQGNNGQIRLRLLPDDGSNEHQPDMNATPLAESVFVPGTPVEFGRPLFADIYFGASQPMQAGQLYHLVMENIDPDPWTNFISSNNAITHADNARPARWLAGSDWATLLGKRNPGSSDAIQWTDLVQNPLRGNYYTPVLEITTAEGAKQGAVRMESGAVDPDRVFTISDGHPLRERFVPGSTKQVSGLSVATAASVAGNLHWRILDGETELASGTITADAANYEALATDSPFRVAKSVWYDITLPVPVTLQAGQTYDVEFQPEGGSEWKFSVSRNGSTNGFAWPAAFTESHAEHLQDGQWINANHFSHYSNGRGDTNWPVVLHLAP